MEFEQQSLSTMSRKGREKERRLLLEAAKIQANKDLHTAELLSSLTTLYTSGDYSDLTISCGEETYRVHKAVLCPRSDFFDRACKGSFKEARENHIDLSEDDPQAVKAMIFYLYHLDYTADPPSEKSPETPAQQNSDSQNSQNAAQTTEIKPSPGPESYPSDVIQHTNVYAIAEQYNITGLKTAARQKFASASQSHWNTYEYLKAVQQVYTTTRHSDRGLRNLVLQTFRERPSLLDSEEAKVILRDTDMLAYELLYYKHTGQLAPSGFD